ncbi:putative ABC transport system permease protein [Croceifilum oryzae]|uniref:ABC transport system permease protein n=1 Tax=Croceifilum oryzae TaxID=1553429 RepID=A0AAJ1WRG4_9BACL|nr:ABC transporter permease [Croceifilum oryzae]MDQ0415978.1 putative ABC transport system permease protein [Croceifilum oryzae]
MTFKQFALRNVQRNLSSYLAFFMASTISVMVFFIFSVAYFHPDMHIANKSMNLTVLLTAILPYQYGCSLVFILYSFGTFLHRRWGEFGVLRLLGITDQQFIKLMFFENVLIGFISIISGILLGLLFSKYFFFVISMIFQFRFEFKWSSTPIVLTFIAFISLFMLVSILSPLFVRSKNVYYLLTKSRKQNRRPKAPLLSAIFGITIVLFLYSLLVNTIQHQNGLNNLFLAKVVEYLEYDNILAIFIILTIITYLIFSQVSALGITLLKRSSRFYFHKTNLLWVSNLAHQAKQNARNLFISTVLITISITFTASLYTGYLYTAEQVIKDFVGPISYLSFPQDKQLKENINYIDTYLKKNGYEFERVQIPVLALNKIEDQTRNEPAIALISNSNFNQLARFLGRDMISLKENDSLVLIWKSWGPGTDPLAEIGYQEMEIGDRKINVIEVTDKPFLNFGAQIYYVISDTFYRQVKAKYPTYTFVEYQIPNWTRLGDFSAQLTERFNIGPRVIKTAANYFQSDLIHNKTYFFIGSFISMVFFIAAISFLYFRLFADIQGEREKYHNLTKIGLKRKEIRRIITQQLVIFFFSPFIIASVHTYIILVLWNQENIEWAPFDKILQVITIFGAIQILYFIWIRSKYIRTVFHYLDQGKN